MFDKTLWPRNYFESRETFLSEARSCGAQLALNTSELLGPSNESLSVDVAACISDSDTHRIVLTSGLHGAEGFVGAAIQRQVLRILSSEGLPERVGIVLIHAANPWGFAHQRRVDENNVDVNRNFVDFSNALLKNADPYSVLDPIINAPTAPGFTDDVRYWLSAGKLIAKHRGVEPLAGPIAEGQYHFPKGLFFGGNHLTESRERLEQCVRKYTAKVPQVTVLDIHSGLGPSGLATLISNSNRVPDNQRVSWLQKHYDMPAVLDSSPDNAYDARGTWSQWCAKEFADQQFTFLCVEIGTVNPIKLFNALRRENQAHHWAAPDSRAFSETKQALVNVFAPESARWREKAVGEGVKAYRKTLLLNE